MDTPKIHLTPADLTLIADEEGEKEYEYKDEARGVSIKMTHTENVQLTNYRVEVRKPNLDPMHELVAGTVMDALHKINKYLNQFL